MLQVCLYLTLRFPIRLKLNWETKISVRDFMNALLIMSAMQDCHFTRNLELNLKISPDDGGSKDLWNSGKLLPDYTALQPRRQPSSYPPPWEPQFLIKNILFIKLLIEPNYTFQNWIEIYEQIIFTYFFLFYIK
jgi:hypothetical protein